jgi:hypothetical protein
MRYLHYLHPCEIFFRQSSSFYALMQVWSQDPGWRCQVTREVNFRILTTKKLMPVVYDNFAQGSATIDIQN